MTLIRLHYHVRPLMKHLHGLLTSQTFPALQLSGPQDPLQVSRRALVMMPDFSAIFGIFTSSFFTQSDQTAHRVLERCAVRWKVVEHVSIRWNDDTEWLDPLVTWLQTLIVNVINLRKLFPWGGCVQHPTLSNSASFPSSASSLHDMNIKCNCKVGRGSETRL